eukprot:CAMPEP_0197403070 /NCGR_PEP_ID=MMETSP1165-20131217/21046_1 /TAXON_ID=284809 /ORGANISM="Chrysocystis fragilis, Strain CCMP3189" /LENGTH=174 /DNA_ID=CAMNT_0042929265 /DNA_START=73 /DNA_END=593 /DNA_ORIENTATION=-
MKAQAQLAAYELIPDLELDFLDGIHECTAAEAEAVAPAHKRFFPTAEYGPYREWWNSRTDAESGEVVYERFDAVVDAVAAALRANEYDGLIGFSQGGAVAAVVVAMMMHGRFPDLTPLRFAWFQGTFAARHGPATHFFDGLREGPRVLVTTYAEDPFVPPAATRKLAGHFPAAA